MKTEQDIMNIIEVIERDTKETLRILEVITKRIEARNNDNSKSMARKSK